MAIYGYGFRLLYYPIKINNLDFHLMYTFLEKTLSEALFISEFLKINSYSKVEETINLYKAKYGKPTKSTFFLKTFWKVYEKNDVENIAEALRTDVLIGAYLIWITSKTKIVLLFNVYEESPENMIFTVKHLDYQRIDLINRDDAIKDQQRKKEKEDGI